MLQAFRKADVQVAVIWIPMLRGDNAAAARAAMALVRDPRVRHWYDSERLVGRAVASSLGADGETAWDMYLFYASNAAWAGDAPPLPLEWLHQLKGRAWADQARLRQGERLPPALRAAAGRIFAVGPER